MPATGDLGRRVVATVVAPPVAVPVGVERRSEVAARHCELLVQLCSELVHDGSTMVT
jgi:hypothetical protein